MPATMSDSNDQTRVQRRAVVVGGCVALVLGVVAVGSAYRIAADGELGQIRGEFHRAAAEATASVQRAVGEHVRLLQDAAVLEQSTESADRHRFADLVTPLLGERSGIRALEWVPRVRHQDRGTYVLAAREAGLANFEFRDRRDGRVSAPATRRAEYLPVYFVEPMAGNEAALGFDMSGSPVHAAMLARAQDSGALAASPRLRLVEQVEPAYGLLLAAPVFGRGAANVTVSQRRDSVRGYLVGVVTPESIMSFGLGEWSQPDIEVSLWDRTDTSPALLASYRQGTIAGPQDQAPTGPGADSRATDLVESATVSFGDRTWEVRAEPSAMFWARQQTGAPTWIAGIVALVCGLIGIVGVWLYARWRSTAFLAQQRAHALERAQAEADASRRDKVEFLGAVSYEIRTPLNGLMGMVDLLMDTRLDPEQFSYALAAREAGVSLLALIHDVLDYSRIEADRLPLSLRPTRVRALCEEAVATAAPQAEEKDLRLELEIDGEVPRLLELDGERLQKIMASLLATSVATTSSGRVTLYVGWHDGQLRFRVVDTSLGLHVERDGELAGGLARSPAAKYWGASLGLAISRKLIKLMGGELTVSSVPGEGTEYAFAITSLELEGDEPPTFVGIVDQSGLPIGLRGSVLLVEDERVSQVVARKLLEKLGLTVETADDGVAAVEAATARRFDVIFMDCRMPNMDGLEATRAIRAYEAEHGLAAVPIVALTAAAMSGDRETCLRAGMTEHIPKPIHARKVATVLARLGLADGPAANDTRAA